MTQAEYVREWTDKRAAAGLCTRCGLPNDREDRKTCSACAEKAKVYEGRRKPDDGKCYGCGGDVDSGFKSCEKCRTEIREEYRAYASNCREIGACYGCGGEKDLPDVMRCSVCTYKVLARQWLGSSTQWTALRDLFVSQGGLCAGTGVALALGVNASVDHKIPRALGGNNEIRNLQWVTYRYNEMKMDHTDDELAAECEAILAHRRAVSR